MMCRTSTFKQVQSLHLKQKCSVSGMHNGTDLLQDLCKINFVSCMCVGQDLLDTFGCFLPSILCTHGHYESTQLLDMTHNVYHIETHLMLKYQSSRLFTFNYTQWLVIMICVDDGLCSLDSSGDWPNPFRRGERVGKIPTTSGEATSGRNFEFFTSHERYIPIPHAWFSRRGGKIIPTTRGGAKRSLEW